MSNVLCTLIHGFVIPYEREVRINVFGLVVRPDGGVERLVARSVHGAAGRFVDALADPYLREGEHGIHDRVGCFQGRLSGELFHHLTGAEGLLRGIDGLRLLVGLVAGDGGREVQCVSRVQVEGARCVEHGLQQVGVVCSFGSVGVSVEFGLGNLYAQGLFPFID